ncbi:MAG: DUF4091 domain-containing protein, partial [Nitrospirae bacterium]|nr:DUF4091 domain-containing protein [Candidatus Manganitrophaceae bacterium]
TIQGATGEWPDALIPKKDEYVGELRNAFPFSVGAGRNQPIWIEIYIPVTAAAGVYSGSATVTASGQNPVVVPIQLTVWNFTLPSTATLKSAYSIDYHLITLGHQIGKYDPEKKGHLDLVTLYTKANLLHRLTNDYLPGPQTLPGKWAQFDSTFGPFLDGTASLPGGKLSGAKETSYRMSVWSHETDVPFLKEVALHTKSKGWFDRVFEYTSDEPKTAGDWKTIRVRATALHQADPKLRALVTTSYQSASKNGVASLIDLFVPTLRFMDNKPAPSPRSEVPGGNDTIGNQRSRYGPEVWWYQACGSHGCGIIGGGPEDRAGYHTGWPAVMIDLPAMFNRIMQWMTFKYHIQGELYYDMVYAFGSGDPWTTQYYYGGNGDGTLYYPGRPDQIGGKSQIPIESIRLKLLREGMEDYEYLALLKGLGEEAFAQQQAARLVTNTYTWSKDPALLYEAREKVALQILSHLNPAAAPPNPTPAR